MRVDFSNKNLGFVCRSSVFYFILLVIHFYCFLQKYPSMTSCKFKKKEKKKLILQYPEFEKPCRALKAFPETRPTLLGRQAASENTIWDFLIPFLTSSPLFWH